MSDLWEGRSQLQELYPRIFISNFFGAKKKSNLEKHSISHIINCTEDLPCPFEATKTYLRIPIADNTHVNVKQYFKTTAEWIDKAIEESPSNNILIHCASGSSRSATIAISYIIQKRVHLDESTTSMISKAQEIRPIILPNPGFIEQLEQYSQELKN